MEYDSNILKFFLTASNLKRLKRKGWISKASIDSSTAESVADHSYMLALIALVISDLKHMDTCKVLKISLLHDLAESIVGDYMPEELDKEEKRRLEDNAIRELLSLLPEDVSKEYALLWEDYVSKKSKESLLVHEIDKFEMALQAKVYEHLGYDKEHIKQFYEYAKPYINDPLIKHLFEKLLIKNG
jgi:putative hydrolase of HD superfamily